MESTQLTDKEKSIPEEKKTVDRSHYGSWEAPAELDAKESDREVTETKEKTPPSEYLGNVTYLAGDEITFGAELGRGAFGVVHKGMYRGQPLAIKMFNVSGAQTELGLTEAEAYETLDWEITRLANLNHPQLVRFLGLVVINSQPAIVTEFCHGGTLEAFLESGKDFPIEQLWQVALDIASGLAYLHSQGVLHRDLKLANILLDQFGRAKLADFGVAQVDALLQSSEAAVVSRGLKDFSWAAPEEFAPPTAGGENFSGTRASDMYAFGLILWSIWTRKIPFENLDFDQLSAAVQRGERETIPTDCPDEIRTLITRCWEQDPSKRPTAEEVVTALENLTEKLCPKSGFAIRACQAAELLVNEQRHQFQHCLPIHVTSAVVEEDYEHYWQRHEKAADKKESKETAAADAPQPLTTLWDNFLNRPDQSVMLLLGDAGLGKSLSTYQLADALLTQNWKHIAGNKPLSWIPVFIRSGTELWTHSGLEDGIRQSLKALHLEFGITALAKLPLLFIIDGYDELQRDMDPKNLPQLLRLTDFPQAKLIVTCRRHVVPTHEELARFGTRDNLARYELLPLRASDVMTSVELRLRWNAVDKKIYTTRMQTSESLMTVLRNPFVLNLFILSWQTLVKVDFQKLSRNDIYAGFVTHWFSTQIALLTENVRKVLLGDAEHLLQSFCIWAERMAQFGFQQDVLTIEEGRCQAAITSPWLHLRDIVRDESNTHFVAREHELKGTSRSRAILQQEDYVRLHQARSEQFISLSPLKPRFKQWNFIHKSFFEFYIAQYILHALDSKDAAVVTRALTGRRIQVEPGVINFLVEALQQKSPQSEARLAQLLQQLQLSKENPAVATAAANAITILNATKMNFSGMDLSKVRIPGAALPNSIFDGTDLEESDLTDVTLSDAWLRLANLKKAKMGNVQFSELPFFEMPQQVSSASYSSDGRWLAVSCHDHNVYLFDAINQELLHSLKRHHSKVTCSVFFTAEKILASGSWDNTLCLWDPQQGKLIKQLSGHEDAVTCIAAHPHKKLLASGSQDNSIRLWDVDSGACQVFKGHSNWVATVVFHPFQELLISGGHDNHICIWNLQKEEKPKILAAHTNVVTQIIFHPQGTLMASSSDDKTIRLWDFNKSHCLKVLRAHADFIRCIAFHPHRELIASGSKDKTIFVWNYTDGKVVRSYEGHSGVINSIAFYPDGSRIVSAGDKTVRVWMSESQVTLRRQQSGHVDAVKTIALHPDGNILASGGADQKIYFWHIEQGQCFQMLSGHHTAVEKVVFHPQGKLLASLGSFDHAIYLWNFAQDSKPKYLKGHHSDVTAVAFHPDGKLLVSGSQDRTLRLWDLAVEKCLKVFTGHTNFISGVAFYEKGIHIVSSSKDGTFRIWNIDNGREKTHREEKGITCMAVHPNESQFALGCGDKNIRIWNAKEKKFSQVLRGHQGEVKGLAFHPNKDWLASGSQDGSARVWETTTGNCIADAKGFSKEISSVIWAPTAGDALLITGSHDKAVRAWRVESTTGQLRLLLHWASRQTALVAEGACITAAEALSPQHQRLLMQHGAVAEMKAPAVEEVKAKRRDSLSDSERYLLHPQAPKLEVGKDKPAATAPVSQSVLKPEAA